MKYNIVETTFSTTQPNQKAGKNLLPKIEKVIYFQSPIIFIG